MNYPYMVVLTDKKQTKKVQTKKEAREVAEQWFFDEVGQSKKVFLEKARKTLKIGKKEAEKDWPNVLRDTGIYFAVLDEPTSSYWMVENSSIYED